MATSDEERAKQAVRAAACDCEFCLRDGPHEPKCAVHRSPPADCSCGRSDQSKGAG